jgi:hypothetical protein
VRPPADGILGMQESSQRKDVLMSAAVARQDEQVPEHDAARVMNIVADRLTDHDLDILGPAWGEAHTFRVSNVRRALCEITVRDCGSLAWEYRPFRGYLTDPAHLTGIAAEALAAGAAAGTADGAGPRTAAARTAGLTLKGAVGLALRERGLHARLGHVMPDEAACEVNAEVEITNPARPDRGAVWVSDDGMLRWECRVGGDRSPGGVEPGGVQPGGVQPGGIEPLEIAETIARAIEP